MANEMQTFYHSEFGELGVVFENDKFYFPATKCAEILGYTSPRDAIKRHCIDPVVKHDGVSLTTNQYGVTSKQKNDIKQKAK